MSEKPPPGALSKDEIKALLTHVHNTRTTVPIYVFYKYNVSNELTSFHANGLSKNNRVLGRDSCLTKGESAIIYEFIAHEDEVKRSNPMSLSQIFIFTNYWHALAFYRKRLRK